jgi:hypothetical protein
MTLDHWLSTSKALGIAAAFITVTLVTLSRVRRLTS